MRPTDGTGCPRCGFVVYEAEKMISKNKMWHKRCFNCSDCHRSLDSTNLCDGPNGEIYCRGQLEFFNGLFLDQNLSKFWIFWLFTKILTFLVQSCQIWLFWFKFCKNFDFFGSNSLKFGLFQSKFIKIFFIDYKNFFLIFSAGCYGRNYGPRGVGFGMGAGVLSMV